MYEIEYAKKCLGKCCYMKTQEHNYLQSNYFDFVHFLFTFGICIHCLLCTSFSWHKKNLAVPKHYIRKIQENHKKLELSWKVDNVNLCSFNTQTTKKYKFYQILYNEAGLKVKSVFNIFLSCHWHVTTQRWLKNPSKL